MLNIIYPVGCLPVHRGYIHVYDHRFQSSSYLKPLGQSKPNFMWRLLVKGKESLYTLSRSHDQDGCHAHTCQKLSNLLLQNQKSYDLKTWHAVSISIKFYINDDPGLTLTYFTAMSNWVTYTFELGKTIT